MKPVIAPSLLLRLLAMLAACLLIAGLALTAVYANGSSPYSVSWYTFEGGGGTSSGSGYTISGTIGQPDASSQTGSGYTLNGGFWAWVGRYLGYLPMLRKP